jgi:SAM-dependent methyltransferase
VREPGGWSWRLIRMNRKSLKSSMKRVIDPRVSGQVKRSLPRIAPSLQRSALYYPHRQGAIAYSRSEGTRPDGALPVPPREFWAGYGTSPEGYLASGHEDVESMRKLLAGSGAPIEGAGRILDLACAGGRMIRHLTDLTPVLQVWGCDIWADAVEWCHAHLSPPFWFATTTVVPHLPFEEGSFGLAYCGSLFTHIDDLAEAWFLELHRIIRPGGRLLFSINDRHAVTVLEGRGDAASYPRYWERTGGREPWEAFVAGISAEPDFRRFRDGDAWMVSMGRDGASHVMWDADVLCERLAYGWRPCSVTPRAYGHQTVILLERA